MAQNDFDDSNLTDEEKRKVDTNDVDLTEDMSGPQPDDANLDKEAPTGPVEDDYGDGNQGNI